MKWLRKKTLFLIFVGLLLIVMAACGGGNDGSGNSGGNDKNSGDGNEPKTITFLIDNQTVTDGLEAVSADVEEKFNIKTEFELRPGGTEGDNIVKTRLATDEMTDLMWYNSGSLFQALNPQEYFLDLSGEPFMDKITDDFKNAVTVGDEVYGVPGESSFAGGWMYNIKLYEELGLEVPSTWDELLANNEKIKEAGKIPVLASFKDTWTSQVILLGDYYNVHSENPEFADEFTHNKAKFASNPTAVGGFGKLYELQEAGHYNDEEIATSYEDAIEMLATGEAAHYPMLTTTLQAINDRFPELVNDIGFFGQPGDDPDNHGATIWIPATITANKNSENIDAAKQWLEYFVSEDGQETYMAAMPAYGPYALHDVELPEDSYQAVKDMMVYQEEGKTAPALEFLSPLKGPNLEQITVEAGLGMSTAEEAAEKYDRDVERQAKQLKIEGW